MESLWRRFERWLLDRAPAAVFRSLAPPATDAAIEALETTLGVRLPDDVRESFRIHDGQRAPAPGEAIPGLVDCRELLSLARVRDEWSVWKGLLDAGTFGDSRGAPGDAPIVRDWWNARWIPLTYDGSGNHDCLDLAPAPGGTPGQMIGFWHDDPERVLLAPSFRAWFEAFVEGCEAGTYVYSDDYGGIVEADDA